MLTSLLAGVAAAVCYGVAVVMQAVAVRQASNRTRENASDRGGVDPGLLPRMLRQWRFTVSIALDLLGFAAQLAALRKLPLFAVQAMVAANLAVAAVLAAASIKATLENREWLAVAGVIAGVGLLGSSAGPEGASQASAGAGLTFRAALIIAVAVMSAAGLAATRIRGSARTLLLGTVAGLGYGVVGVAARVLTGFGPLTLLTDLAAYAVVAGGVIAFLFYATALEGGSVAVATAAVVLAETLPPAVIGVLFLGDKTRPGFLPVAVAGFVLAVASAVLLARFGEGAANRESNGRVNAGTTAVGAEESERGPGTGVAAESADRVVLLWWPVDLRLWAVTSLTTGVLSWPLQRLRQRMLIPSIFSSPAA